jgi:hypothetical protein
MKPDEIDAIEASQKTDLLIAEKVLKMSADEWNALFFTGRTKFSTDAGCAIDALERTKPTDYTIEKVGAHYCVNIMVGSACAETLSLAICKVLLYFEVGND